MKATANDLIRTQLTNVGDHLSSGAIFQDPYSMQTTIEQQKNVKRRNISHEFKTFGQMKSANLETRLSRPSSLNMTEEKPSLKLMNTKSQKEINNQQLATEACGDFKLQHSSQKELLQLRQQTGRKQQPEVQRYKNSIIVGYDKRNNDIEHVNETAYLPEIGNQVDDMANSTFESADKRKGNSRQRSIGGSNLPAETTKAGNSMEPSNSHSLLDLHSNKVLQQA